MLLGGLIPVPVTLLFSDGILPVTSQVRVDAVNSALDISEPALMLASISRSPSTEVGVCRGPAVECSVKSDVDWVGVSLKTTGMVFVGDPEKDADFGLRSAARRVS